jgi:hypothetical protein
MSAFVFGTLVVLAVTVIARLVTVVVNDRPSSPPRSHIHELNPR